MGATKTSEFDQIQNELADLAKAIAHPARVAILQHLITTGNCVCRSIVDELPLSQSTVSQHLAELKKVGLIKGEVNGPSVCYCIDPDTWAKAARMLAGLFESYKSSDCCQ